MRFVRVQSYRGRNETNRRGSAIRAGIDYGMAGVAALLNAAAPSYSRYIAIRVLSQSLPQLLAHQTAAPNDAQGSGELQRGQNRLDFLGFLFTGRLYGSHHAMYR